MEQIKCFLELSLCDGQNPIKISKDGSVHIIHQGIKSDDIIRWKKYEGISEAQDKTKHKVDIVKFNDTKDFIKSAYNLLQVESLKLNFIKETLFVAREKFDIADDIQQSLGNGKPELIVIQRQDIKRSPGEDVPQLLGYFLGACLGLKGLHDNEIIHQNITPENIFWREDDSGQQFIAILGGLEEYSVEKEHVDTKYREFTPPEALIAGKQHVNTKSSDIWSLGETFLFLITGSRIFSDLNELYPISVPNGLKPKSYESFGSHMSFKNFIPEHFDKYKDLKDALKTLIDSTLTRKPEERPTINKVLTDIMTFIKQQSENKADMNLAQQYRMIIDAYNSKLVNRLDEVQPVQNLFDDTLKLLLETPEAHHFKKTIIAPMKSTDDTGLTLFIFLWKHACLIIICILIFTSICTTIYGMFLLFRKLTS